MKVPGVPTNKRLDAARICTHSVSFRVCVVLVTNAEVAADEAGRPVCSMGLIGSTTEPHVGMYPVYPGTPRSARYVSKDLLPACKQVEEDFIFSYQGLESCHNLHEGSILIQHSRRGGGAAGHM